MRDEPGGVHDLCDVPGVRVGHWTHPSGTTGVSVVVFPDGATGGVHVPGSAAGSRELGALSPEHIAGRVDAFVLSGGSAFGLAAADGVMGALAARNQGFDTGSGVVPIVPAAVLFDLHTAVEPPDRAAGEAATQAAFSVKRPRFGRVGAGAGAQAGKASGSPVPGGIGSFAARSGAFTVGAMVAVNAVGSVRDPDTGEWVAGGPSTDGVPQAGDWRGQTTLAVVAVDAPLDRARCGIVAKMAAAGLARTLFPAFTPFDGDTVFVASTGQGTPVDNGQLMALGDVAAHCVARAVVEAVR